MTVRWSTSFRNAFLDWMATTGYGANYKINLRKGTQPAAGVDAASTGTVIATYDVVTPTAGAAGVKQFCSNGPSKPALAAVVPADLMHYEITNAAGTTVYERGAVGVTGDGTADMTIDNMTIALNQNITITGLQKTAPGA